MSLPIICLCLIFVGLRRSQVLKHPDLPLYSKRKEAKNRSANIKSGPFGTCDPNRT